jgi:hypothetical protein
MSVCFRSDETNKQMMVQPLVQIFLLLEMQTGIWIWWCIIWWIKVYLGLRVSSAVEWLVTWECRLFDSVVLVPWELGTSCLLNSVPLVLSWESHVFFNMLGWSGCAHSSTFFSMICRCDLWAGKVTTSQLCSALLVGLRTVTQKFHRRQRKWLMSWESHVFIILLCRSGCAQSSRFFAILCESDLWVGNDLSS